MLWRRRASSLLAGLGSLPVFYVGYLCVLAAALLLAPALALWLTRAIRPLLCWLRPVEGALAADSLIAAPRRTSATVAALMLSLALVIGLAGTRARQLCAHHRLGRHGAEPGPVRHQLADADRAQLPVSRHR